MTIDNMTTDNVNHKGQHTKGPNNEEIVPVSDSATAKPKNTEDSYEGRKYDPEIDGPQQKSQETDEIYADPRKEEDLPAGGKNVGDLDAHDLSQKGNEI
ncbi:hypothetical protein H4W00_001122 [Psychrobacter sp. PL19]|uniref:hypothetical protein n=1 Tax=Psychrobacter sp. PL19 TaxID=2760711 RepID=UPI001AE13F58